MLLTAAHLSVPASAQEPSEPPVRLPPDAKGRNLHPIYVSATAEQEFLVDLDSISVEGRDLVRYLVVAVGSGGARNVSYEGIRCDPLQRRTYAYGKEDGGWAAVRDENWSPIRSTSSDRRYAALAADYFCKTDGSPKAADAIRWAIRTNASAAPRGS